MRNLKKFLALVLAIMMAASLMLTANAAVTANVDFPDDYNVEPAFEEAVTVLAGMGVFKGDEKGNFNPANTITRAETAAIIYRLITADVEDDKATLYHNVDHPFVDVTPDKWYAGYVGYLWNAGIIKGVKNANGTSNFNPAGSVTGYEALAMILRAVGYGKNGEFEGGEWIYNVAMIANNKGVLTDVNKTNYGNSALYSAARRDVVASLLFNTAAYVPQVTYTPALGYQETGMSGGVIGTAKNPTLGYTWFGLTNHHGVVVGNEATGEGKSVTKIGFSWNTVSTNVPNGWQAIDVDSDDVPDYYRPTYGYTTDDINNKVSASDGGRWAYDYEGAESFKWDSGLDMFGHAASVWYDGRDGVNKDTYAVFDEATLVEVVAGVDTVDLTSTGTGTLKSTAGAAGFKVGTNTNWNYSFGRNVYDSSVASGFTSPIGVNNSDEINNGNDDANPLYLLISNSANKHLDMVISLDMTITQITQRNNTTTGNYSIGVLNENGTGTPYFDVEDTESVGTTQNYTNILKKALVGNSTETLGDKVAAIEITGTTGRVNDPFTRYGNNGQCDDTDGGLYNNTSSGLYATKSNYYYQLTKLNHVVSATVVRFDDADETVYLSDGSKMEKSPFANAVDGTFKDNQFVNAPRNYGTYNFTLDENGKYIYWETINEASTFVYGTYFDYTTVTASSSFDYPLVYVDTNGAKGQANITKIDGNAMNYNRYTGSTLNRRSADNTATDAGYVKGAYVGYALSSNGELRHEDALGSANTGFKQATADNFGNAVIDIDSKDVSVGAKGFGDTGNLMLTENTKFYIVNGAGNDNQKVETYNGISDLMKNMSKVEIDVTASAKLTTKAGTYLAQNAAPYEMVYYKAGWAEYGQNYVGSAEEVKVVYIPKECVKFTPTVDSNLFFVGDSDSKLINSYGADAVLFTMYQNGVENTYWIKGEYSDATTDAGKVYGNDNVFYCLIPTSSKAQDGRTIYEIAPVADANEKVIGRFWDSGDTISVAGATTTTEALYSATTYSSQIAYIGDDSTRANNQLYNVGKATVLNLSGGATDKYPGIDNTLSSLNNAGSITDNVGVEVSCVLDGNDTNHLTVAHIYVNANA